MENEKTATVGNRRNARGIIIIVLLLGIVFSFTGVSDRIIGIFGTKKLAETNEIFLQKTFDRALNGFVVLSGIKMAVAVVEGSAVGVGFSLELGDVAQPAYDYVDIAWRTVFTGSVVLLMTRYFLDIASFLDHWVLAGCLLFLLSFLVLQWYFPAWRRIGQITRGCALLLFILSVSLYFVLPISVAGGAYLSEKITGPVVEKAEETLTGVQDTLMSEGNESETKRNNAPPATDGLSVSSELPRFTKKLAEFPERTGNDKSATGEKPSPERFTGDTGGLFSKLRGAKDRVEFVGGYLAGKTREMTVLIVKLIAGYIFDCILFPYLLLIILLWFTRSAAIYLFGFTQRQSFRNDLDELLRNYYGMEKLRTRENSEQTEPKGNLS